MVDVEPARNPAIPQPDQPPIGGYCDTCGHMAARHDEDGCHGVTQPYRDARCGVPGRQPCRVMRWAGVDWPRPWLSAPEGLTKDGK